MQFTKTAAIGTILSLAALMPNAYAVKSGQKFKDWQAECMKIGEKEECGISQIIFDKKKTPFARIFVRKIKGQNDPIAFVTVPLGVALQAGVGIAVDKKGIGVAPYSFCSPEGCNAAFPISSKVAAKMKKGSKIQIAMAFIDQRNVEVEGSLSGFTNAFKSL